MSAWSRYPTAPSVAAVLAFSWQRDGAGRILEAMADQNWQMTGSREMVAGVPLLLLSAWALGWHVDHPGLLIGASATLYLAVAVGLALTAPRQLRRFGWPNRVTLVRAMLVIILAAALLEPAIYRDHGWLLASIALLALALDGLDGWLARRLDLASEFGARFDMEVDAALIMVLCLGLVVSGKVGPWALAIGLVRYCFVLAMVGLPWLKRPLPERFRRKLVCVWQVASLLIALLPIVSPVQAGLILAFALVLLGLSFAIDVAWLWRQRDTHSVPNTPGGLHEKSDSDYAINPAVQRPGPGRAARIHD